MRVHTVTAADRASFKRCRRAWDLGAGDRRNLERRQPPRADLAGAIREALAVHYFPGMWSWDRSIVRPLVFAALTKELDRQRDAGAGIGDTFRGEAERLLGAYLDWIGPQDRFEPIHVSGAVTSRVPDPDRPGHDLLAPDGGEVRYAALLDAVVVDDARRYWLLDHRITTGAWTIPELLSLDEASVAACWAWQHAYLEVRFQGVIHDELRPELLDRADDDAASCFRRTTVRHSLDEVARMGTRLGAEAREMVEPGLDVYPTPRPSSCRPCPYREPCLAVERDGDAEAVLAADYRPRPEPEEAEPRIGNPTWSTGRGAAPPTFGRRKS